MDLIFSINNCRVLYIRGLCFFIKSRKNTLACRGDFFYVLFISKGVQFNLNAFDNLKQISSVKLC